VHWLRKTTAVFYFEPRSLLPRSFTFYVAHPIRSILISPFTLGALAVSCTALLGLIMPLPRFDHIFYFLIMSIVVLCDLIYALPEFCSIVSEEVCGLQRLCVFM